LAWFQNRCYCEFLQNKPLQTERYLYLEAPFRFAVHILCIDRIPTIWCYWKVDFPQFFVIYQLNHKYPLNSTCYQWLSAASSICSHYTNNIPVSWQLPPQPRGCKTLVSAVYIPSKTKQNVKRSNTSLHTPWRFRSSWHFILLYLEEI
jgi:hypothetical protein